MVMLSNQGDPWREGRRVQLTYLLKNRERRQVGHLAAEEVTAWGRMLWAPRWLPGQALPGDRTSKGLSTRSQGRAVRLAVERLQSRAGRCWPEKGPDVSVTGTQLHSSKKHISGDLSREG